MKVRYYVYPLGTGSLFDDLELLYSLRSIERFHPEGVPFRVVVVGEYPRFLYQELEVIHHPDPYINNKRGNAYSKLRRFLEEYPDVDEFVVMHDDFIFLSEITDELLIPRYQECFDLPDEKSTRSLLSSKRGNQWKKEKAFTADWLRSNGYPTRDYEFHRPQKIVAVQLSHVLELMSWEGESVSVCEAYLSMINNIYDNGSVPGIDVKVDPRRRTYDKQAEKTPDCISLSPQVDFEWLENVFPQKSRFER